MPLVAAAVCPSPPLIVPEIAAGAAAELNDLRAACDAAVDRLWAARPDGILIMGTGVETAWRRPDEYGSFAPWGVPLEVVPGGRGRPDLPLSLMVGAWLLSRSRHTAAAVPGVTGGAGSAVPGVTGAASAVPGVTAAAPGGAVDLGLVSVAADEPPAGCAAFGRDQCAPWRPRVALLAIADGSACRGPTSPGYGDPRAEPFDASVTRALAVADLDGLMAVDPVLGGALMAAGRPVWQALAGAAGGGAALAGAAPGGAALAGAAPGGAARGGDWRAEVSYDAAPYGVNYTVAVWERA